MTNVCVHAGAGKIGRPRGKTAWSALDIYT